MPVGRAGGAGISRSTHSRVRGHRRGDAGKARGGDRREWERAFGLAALDRPHDQPRRALGARRDGIGRAGVEREPAIFVILIAAEFGVQVGAGPHQPRHDRRHGDAVVGQFRPESFRQPDVGELGAGVGQQMRHGDLAADRRDVDDAAGAALPHARQGGQRRVEHAPEVDRHHPFEIGVGQRFDRRDDDDPGIVDQDVDPSVTLGDGLDHDADLCTVGDIARNGQDFGPDVLQVGAPSRVRPRRERRWRAGSLAAPIPG
jgi:hypothetical protein